MNVIKDSLKFGCYLSILLTSYCGQEKNIIQPQAQLNKVFEWVILPNR